MKEVYGDAMAYRGRNGYIICLTTNGFVKKDGTGVMGRGIAKQAADEDETLPALLGKSIQTRGNVVSRLTQEIISFPTKNNWYENSDPELIVRSAIALKAMAEESPAINFILPRPGCGNGGLKWEDIRPLLELLELPENIWILATWEEKPK